MTQPALRRIVGMLLMAAAMVAPAARAVQLNLATLSCAQYVSDVFASNTPGHIVDPIDTVMWLFGFSVAKSGDRVMYGDSLAAFGFALDAQCKNNPASNLLDAVAAVRSRRGHPMDLTRLDCATFEKRHVEMRMSDPESANTLTMWLFGYAVGLSGGHVLEADAVGKFDSSLEQSCTQRPLDSLFDALSARNPSVPAPRPAPRNRRR